MIVNRRKLLYLVGYILFSIISTIYIGNSNINFLFIVNDLAVFNIVLLVVQTIVSFKCFQKISFSIVFVWCCHLFWLSQNFLLSIGYNFGFQDYYLAYLSYGKETYCRAMVYATYATIYTFLGLLIEDVIDRRKKNNGFTQIQIPSKIFVIPLLLICFGLDFYQTIQRVYTALTVGYEEAHDAAELSNSLQTFIQLFPITVYFLIISYIHEKKKAKLVFLLFIMYELFKMLAGARAYAVLGIIVMTILYYHSIESLDIKKFFIISAGVIIVLELLVIIRYGRYKGTYTVQITGIFDLAAETMKEFGLTIRAFSQCFDKIEYHANGMGIVNSLLSCIPKYSAIFGDEFFKQHYTYFALDLKELGSAFPIDYFFDFGYVGGLAGCFFHGVILRYVDKNIFSNLVRGRYVNNAFWILMITELLYSVRSYPMRIPRYAIYFAVIFGAYKALTSLFSHTLIKKYKQTGGRFNV